MSDSSETTHNESSNAPEQTTENSGATSQGPTRANTRAVSRPGTTFVSQPITPSVNPSLASSNLPAIQDITLEDSTTPAEKAESPKPAGPQRAASTGRANRPGTTFVNQPIRLDNNPSLKGSDLTPAAKVPDYSQAAQEISSYDAQKSASPAPTNVNDKDKELKAKEIEEAAKCKNLRVNANELLQYSTSEEIWDRSSAVAILKSKMENLFVLEQLYSTLSDPTKVTIFGTLSSGLGEIKLTELRNKMMCVASLLIMQVNNATINGIVLRHNLLDKVFTDLLLAKGPIEDLRAHYLREVMNNIAKYKKEAVLNFLAGDIPSQPGRSRASLLVDHFYCNNIAYLFDELVGLEEGAVHHYTELAKHAPARGAPAGPPRGAPNRGAPRGGPNRGAPAAAAAGRGGPGPARGAPGPARGGPPRGAPARGGPPGARGASSPGGAARGGAGPARGAPGAGRGGAPGSPGNGGPSLPFTRWTKIVKLPTELLNQLNGGEKGTATKGDVAQEIFAQQRATNAAHVLQGLFFRGRDEPTIDYLLENLDSFLSAILGLDSPWRGVDVFEAKIKLLTSVLKYLNKEWKPVSVTPHDKLIERTVDKLMTEICTGKISQALKAPPTNSTVPPLAIMKSLDASDSCGGVRIQLLQFLSFITLVKFLPQYETRLVQSGLVRETLRLFFAHQHNYFLHETVVKKVLINILKCKSDALFEHLIVDCDMLQLIIDHFQPVNKTRTKNADSYTSYNGHLLWLINAIQTDGYLQRLSNQNLPVLTKWNAFINKEVAESNRVHTYLHPDAREEKRKHGIPL